MSSKDGAEVRARAARVVAAVAGGRSLDAVLDAARKGLPILDQGLLTALSFGVLRDRRLLQTLIQPLSARPPAPLVQALLLVGVYQLRSLRVPAHAAVHATVAASARLGQPRARGLVNAVLRRYQRERAELEAAVPDKAAVQNSYPDWLVATLRRDWPGEWETVLGAGNRPGPMTLRVNTRRTTPAAYRQRLADAGIQAAPHPHAPQALTLAQPQAVTELPGFDAGEISVQDAAAQLAAPLLEIQPGMRVLDACAAPGGKTAHCLELADCTMTALDADPARVALVAQNLSRLGLACGVNLIHADATAARDWWDGQPFDRILVDAPCTGTGVIRRHPDIKWLRRETDVAALATRQQTLLDALWPSLAPGGLLVYATCSLLRAEGADVIRAFLASHPKAVEYPIEAAWGGRDRCGRRIASGEADMDGFYYARLRRPKNGGPGA